MHDRNQLKLIVFRFPHIGKALTYLWGQPEVVFYVNKLFLDSRGGTRRGFPEDVKNALLAIRETHLSLVRCESLAGGSATTPWGMGGGRRERS
jgi:hypothetical protein